MGDIKYINLSFISTKSMHNTMGGSREEALALQCSLIDRVYFPQHYWLREKAGPSSRGGRGRSALRNHPLMSLCEWESGGVHARHLEHRAEPTPIPEGGDEEGPGRGGAAGAGDCTM